ncbi:General stress protein 69 [compost metagenome]
MLNRGIEQDLIPYAQQHDLGIIVYSPMERGLLTGKYFNEGKLKENDHRNGYFQQFDLKKVKTFLDTISPIAADKGVSLSQLVLRWTSLQPAITVVLAGARNAEQAIANAEATAIDLTIDELSFIDTALSKI